MIRVLSIDTERKPFRFITRINRKNPTWKALDVRHRIPVNLGMVGASLLLFSLCAAAQVEIPVQAVGPGYLVLRANVCRQDVEMDRHFLLDLMCPVALAYYPDEALFLKIRQPTGAKVDPRLTFQLSKRGARAVFHSVSVIRIRLPESTSVTLTHLASLVSTSVVTPGVRRTAPVCSLYW